MNPEERKLLDKIANQVEENNAILRGIRRSQRVSTVFRVLYWVLIIGLSLGAFYFLQPYVSKLKDLTSNNAVSNFLKGL